MKHYPLMMSLSGKPVVVVGGGPVALRKVRSLLECGAVVTVVSPDAVPDIEVMAREGSIRWIRAAFTAGHLDGSPRPVLVFGATDRRDVNESIHNAAMEWSIPCNIADVPDLCDFIVPAVVSRGDLIVAVSTSGASPALARRIREGLEETFGPEYALFTRILGRLRSAVIEAGSSQAQNREMFFRLVDSPLLNALKAGDRSRAVEILAETLPDTVDAAAVVDEAFKE